MLGWEHAGVARHATRSRILARLVGEGTLSLATNRSAEAGVCVVAKAKAESHTHQPHNRLGSMRRPRPATATSSTSAGTGGRSLLASSFSLVALSVWGVSLLSVMPPWEVEAFHLARAGAGARPSGAAAAGVAGRIRTLQMRPSSARVIGLDPTRLAAAAASASATSGDDPDPDETFRSFVEEEQDVEDLIESDGEVAEVDDPATAPDVVPGLEDLPELDELAVREKLGSFLCLLGRAYFTFPC